MRRPDDCILLKADGRYVIVCADDRSVAYYRRDGDHTVSPCGQVSGFLPTPRASGAPAPRGLPVRHELRGGRGARKP
jgi:hypothetical protein